jgi:uncharacterized protein (DUF1697 family)
MALIVFLRGVNLARHKRFAPRVFAEDLAAWKVTSHGAAGSFIVRGTASAKSLRAEIVRRLPFPAEIMICSGAELLALVRSRPFGSGSPEKDVKGFVSILSKTSSRRPRLPLDYPNTPDWGVRLVRIAGRFVLSLYRRRASRSVYPNEVVEKVCGVAATTRGWNTVVTLCAALEKG